MEKLKLLSRLPTIHRDFIVQEVAKFGSIPENLSKILITGRDSALMAKVIGIELLNTRDVMFSMAY